MRFKVVSQLVVALLIPAASFGWSTEGHSISSDIATRDLTPAARAAIDAIIPGKSLADVASWADQARGIPEYRFSNPYHMVQVPKGADGFVEDRDCPDHNCAVWAIKHYADELRRADATPKEKEDALKFLVHFVEDLHQPLHAAYKEDRNGGATRVKYFSQQTNLHMLWDGPIFTHRGLSWQDHAKDLAGKITEADKKAWAANLDPVAWANESYKLAISNSYVIPEGGELGEEYYSKNLSVAERRLSMAGVRLAALLNEIFSKDGSGKRE